MLIESLIRRKNGTTVTLGTKPNTRTYTFKATPPDPRHVADVTNDDDVDTLVAIKEGYRLARTAPAAPAKGAAAPPAAPPATPPVLTVAQVGGAKGKWYVMNGAKPVSPAFAEKSDADAALAATEKKDGE
jgi:hypothetical protein